MPRNTRSQKSEENVEMTTSTDLFGTGVDENDASANAEIIAELNARLQAVEAENAQLRASKPSKRAPKEGGAVAAPSRTLNDVRAKHEEKPAMEALKRMIVPAEELVAFGVDPKVAIHEVAERFEGIAYAIMQERATIEGDKPGVRTSVRSHLQENYPRALQGHPTKGGDDEDEE